MSDQSIAARIHGFWESFFPSVVFFGIFIIVWVVLVGVANALTFFDPLVKLLGVLKTQSINQALKDLELLKLLPVGAVFLVAFCLYIFNRTVDFIGRLLPPHPVWEGSPALYVPAHLLEALWMRLPNVTNPAALDFEAKVIIEQAKPEGRDQTETYLRSRFSSAARIWSIAKVGVLWVLISFVWAVVLHRPFLISLLIALLSLVGFALLGFAGIALETHVLLKETEHYMVHALSVLSSTGVDPVHNQERSEEFKKAFANCVRFSRRFVCLSWGSLEGCRALRAAFFGLKRNPPTSQ